MEAGVEADFTSITNERLATWITCGRNGAGTPPGPLPFFLVSAPRAMGATWTNLGFCFSGMGFRPWKLGTRQSPWGPFPLGDHVINCAEIRTTAVNPTPSALARYLPRRPDLVLHAS